MVPKLTPKDVLRFKAIVFDMDGTLINSEPLHMEAIERVLKSMGESTDFLTQDFIHHSVGKADKALIKEVFPTWHKDEIDRFIEKKNKALIESLEAMSQSDLEPLITPGAREFLRSKRETGFNHLFLMTASEAAIVGPLLKKAGLYDYFNEVFSRECTARTKPSSSPYLFLMRRYRLQSTQTLIFEDSPTGIQAAVESGASVIRVSAHIALDEKELHQFEKLQSCDNFLWLC